MFSRFRWRKSYIPVKKCLRRESNLLPFRRNGNCLATHHRGTFRLGNTETTLRGRPVRISAQNLHHRRNRTPTYPVTPAQFYSRLSHTPRFSKGTSPNGRISQISRQWQNDAQMCCFPGVELSPRNMDSRAALRLLAAATGSLRRPISIYGIENIKNTQPSKISPQTLLVRRFLEIGSVTPGLRLVRPVVISPT